MMHDPLSAPLRRHLLETANEQPARGHLEAIVAATAAMPQRRPWAVRLRWLLEPVSPFGPLASTRVRLGFVVIALVLIAAVAGAIGGGTGPRPVTSFEGTWTSTDTADDSTQTLVVAAGQTPTVHFEDDFSINCEIRGEQSTLYIADGQGEISSGRLTVQFPTGGCGYNLPAFEWWYEFVPASDTLIDSQGIVWSRVP